MYQGTESLILEDVRRSGNYVIALIVEPGIDPQVRGRVVIQVHPMYYEDDPLVHEVSGREH